MYKSKIQNSKLRSAREDKKRPLEFPDKDQEYAIVQDMLGNGRVKVICENKQSYIGRICGALRKYKSKTMIEVGDIVLISRRDYETDIKNVDVIYKYDLMEANKLSYEGYLPAYLYKVYTKDEKFSNTVTEEANTEYIFFAENEKEAMDIANI